MITYHFSYAGKLKFGYPDDSDVLFELEDGNIEIDETAFPLYPNSTRFRMRLISGNVDKFPLKHAETVLEFIVFTYGHQHVFI